MRNQAAASEAKIKATDVGSLVRNNIESHYDYQEINTWMNNNEMILTNDNCGSPISCDVFLYESGTKTYESVMTITFLKTNCSIDCF